MSRPIDLSLSEIARMHGSGELRAPVESLEGSFDWLTSDILHFWRSMMAGYPVGSGVSVRGPDGEWVLIDGVQRLGCLLSVAVPRSFGRPVFAPEDPKAGLADPVPAIDPVARTVLMVDGGRQPKRAVQIRHLFRTADFVREDKRLRHAGVDEEDLDWLEAFSSRLSSKPVFLFHRLETPVTAAHLGDILHAANARQGYRPSLEARLRALTRYWQGKAGWEDALLGEPLHHLPQPAGR